MIMVKKLIEKEIFYKVSDKPIPVKEYKHLLEDDDIIRSGFEEGHYSENNSYDSHYYLEVTRMVLETDEEFEKRKIRTEETRKELKELRYKNYLKLKKEFEP
jgi:hypothetical protein